MKLEHAKYIYEHSSVTAVRKIALHYFDEDQLKEPNPKETKQQWPKSWEDLHLTLKHNSTNHKQDLSVRAFNRLCGLQKRMLEISGNELDGGCQYSVNMRLGSLRVEQWPSYRFQIMFPTEEMAKFSLEHHKELWEQYWMIKKD